MQLERNAELEQHASQMMQLRAQLVGRDSIADSLRHELEQLRASLPGLEKRTRLAQRLGQMDERERALRGQVTALKQELARAQAALVEQGTAEAAATRAAADLAAMSAPDEQVVRMPERLAERSVLCVGGHTGNVATYRAMIERVGAQFAHHDGGLENNVNQLESSLAAADLVICQTGCISHSAYWRVKDFCKRTGKRCVFIDNPSISSLARGLQEADLG
jgi:cell division protein FtsB